MVEQLLGTWLEHFLPKGILMPREVPPEEGAGKGSNI